MPDVVKCVSRHAEDLADGRVLAPGATASGVDVSDEHNKRLVEEGRLIVYERDNSKTKNKSNETEGSN